MFTAANHLIVLWDHMQTWSLICLFYCVQGALEFRSAKKQCPFFNASERGTIPLGMYGPASLRSEVLFSWSPSFPLHTPKRDLKPRLIRPRDRSTKVPGYTRASRSDNKDTFPFHLDQLIEEAKSRDSPLRKCHSTETSRLLARLLNHDFTFKTRRILIASWRQKPNIESSKK